MIETPTEWLHRHSIPYRTSGDELEVGCLLPSCPNKGEKQMYINQRTGAFYCHRCSVKGTNLKQLEFKTGMITFKEPVASNHIYISPKKCDEYHEALWKNKEALDYLMRERGLLKRTIVQFYLGYCSERDAIVFPYYDKSDACVGLKYYFYNKPVKPKIKFEQNSKIQLYGLHLMNLKKDVYITEGEFDALTLWQLGYKNVGSIPNGASGLNGWIEEVDTAPMYYLCFDNDLAGQEGAQKLGERLGLTKCKKVIPQLKDWNDYLQCGLTKNDLDKAFKGATPMFNAPVRQLHEYSDEAISIIEHPETYRGVSTGWGSMDYCLGGVRNGELTVVSGITSHGKTTFSMSLVSNLTRHNIKSLIISPEMQESDLLIELANSHYRRAVTTVKQLEDFKQHIDSKVFIANVFNEWTNRDKQSILDRTFDIIEYAVKNKGVKFILLDHMRLLINVKAQDSERFAIDEFMQKCVRMAIAHNIHIWLIVQPKNLPANQRKLTMHDLKGSGNIGQDAHNIILIHRNVDKKKDVNQVEFEIPKVRSRAGNLGSFVLYFDTKSKANYYEKT